MSAQCEVIACRAAGAPMSFFERWLSLWVAQCIVVGVALGQWFPVPFQVQGRLKVAQVNLPVGLLIQGNAKKSSERDSAAHLKQT